VAEQTEAERGTRLLPFWGRITVLPSPVDEEQRESGLVLPHRFEGDEGVRRGVVLHVDQLRHEEAESVAQLVPGTVVYYRSGTPILDVVVVERKDVLVFEDPGDEA
jgi:co-chaperonin GroES (HSP10)